MAGIYGEINSRKEFHLMLNAATTTSRAFLSASPDDGTLQSIHRQLEAIGLWTLNGRIPTTQERVSVDMAVRASREMEGETRYYKWTRDIYSLDAYIERWPSDDEAANATDDDYWDSVD